MIEEEINQLQNIRRELTSAKKKVLELQQELKEAEEHIYSKCEHKWEIDRTNVGVHTEYICLKCYLSKK